MREGFVYLDETVPGARWDAKYFSADNFTGARVDGYEANRVVGSAELSRGLALAAARAGEMGLGLLLWDAYRPARAVRRFLAWAAAPEDNLTRAAHYPNILKTDIVPLGYVCPKSGHSRGGAVDLTLCRGDSGEILDMGGIFDLMDVSSHHGAAGVPEAAARNRRLLKVIMEESGFLPYECEWWHYALRDEPYPDTYFDFVID